jgi:ATP-dependent DNA helicase RecQ
MRVQVLTLRYDPARKAFDDGALRALAAEADVIDVRERVFAHEGLPMLACVVCCEERELGTPARGEGALAIAAPPPQEAPPKPPRPPKPKAPDPREGLSEAQLRRFEALRSWRAARAREQGLPAYALLTNRQLVDVLAARPRDLVELAQVPGVGEGRAKLFGEELLAALRGADAEASASPSPAS